MPRRPPRCSRATTSSPWGPWPTSPAPAPWATRSSSSATATSTTPTCAATAACSAPSATMRATPTTSSIESVYASASPSSWLKAQNRQRLRHTLVWLMWRLLMKKTSSPTARARAKSAMAPRARMSLLSSSAVACAASRRSPAATMFQAPSRPARTARAEMSLGFTRSTPDVSVVAVHDLRRDLSEQVTLDEVRTGLEDPAGFLNVPQSDAARTRQGAASGDRLEDGRHVVGALALTREQGGQLGMDLEGEDQRQRDGAVADVGAGALAGAGLVAAAVEDVVEHLEGQTAEAAVLGERGGRLLPGAGEHGAG